jgi:hypothetical protein
MNVSERDKSIYQVPDVVKAMNTELQVKGEEGKSRFFRNVGSNLPDYTLS